MKNNELSIDELIAKQKPGHSLDQRFYTDPAIYDLEVENSTWLRSPRLLFVARMASSKLSPTYVATVVRSSALRSKGMLTNSCALTTAGCMT